jgi:S1-C subfamily serine protease
MVKQLLSQRGVGYEERDVSRNQAYARELVNNTGQMGIPVTVFDGEIVVGFDRQRLEKLVSNIKTSQRPAFGASIADAGKITAKQGMAAASGAYIGSVKQASAAQKMGLKQGDIIIQLNRKNIVDADDLQRELAELQKGSRISVVFLRNGIKKMVEGVL